VITGVGRRLRWSDDEKARIVAESLDPATTSSAVARRYGLDVSQLFTWRQQLQRRASSVETSGTPGFGNRRLTGRAHALKVGEL
jgi:transposase